VRTVRRDGDSGRDGAAALCEAIISAVVVAAFFGGGYLAAAQWVFPGGRTVKDDSSIVAVPELVGLTEDEAQGRLERVGLEYTVRSGDNLWVIAKHFGVSYKHLAGWNDLELDSVLRPGRKLIVWRS